MKGPALLVAAMMLSAAAAAEEPGLDPVSGLKVQGDWELVRNNCSACHSTRLITQQSGTAEQWLNLIRWMQAEQNLWQFDPDTESRIISYLAENYPPETRQRRAPIAEELMPPARQCGRGCGCGTEEAGNEGCRHRHGQPE
jgi:hypothetical protein